MGEAYSTIKYDSYGSAMDHNFIENDVPLSSVWEVFGDNSTLRALNANMRLMKSTSMSPYKMRLKKLMT